MYQKAKLQKEIQINLALPYAVYEPEDRDGSPLPLVVFLHGAGEREENLEAIDRHGPFKMINEGEKFPFIVAAPQCGKEKYWGNYLERLNYWLDEIIDKHNVDTTRIYLTGLSMGGTGCWQWLMANPERFAAAAPVCGSGIYWYACQIADKPLWIFHGDADPIVPIAESEAMIKSLARYGNHPKFTVFKGAGHNIFAESYTKELFDWFLEHRL